MKTYICWITLMLQSYEDGIVSGLCNKGYVVQSGAEKGSLTSLSDKSSSVIFCAILKTKKDKATDVSEDVTSLLKSKGYLYYSIVITEFMASNATWSNGNVLLEPSFSIKSDQPYR